MTQLAATLESRVSAEALERNALVALPACPFSLPTRDDLTFLTQQRSSKYRHKDICLNPSNGRLQGCRQRDENRRIRIQGILAAFSQSATAWARQALPEYAAGLVPDRATLRTREEATSALRITARNDLLHIDNFPTRPTFGRRILRLFVNIHPSEGQVWAVSETFRELLARYASTQRISLRTAAEWIAPTTSMLGIFHLGRETRSAYDSLMLRLHHFLKQDFAFQTQAARRVYTFAPGSAWLLFSDSLSHAHLRGRFVLEHSFFVEQKYLLYPSESPVAILETQSAMGRPLG